jgi:hypothetical protein
VNKYQAARALFDQQSETAQDTANAATKNLVALMKHLEAV